MVENVKTNYYAILFLICFAALLGYSIVHATRAINAIEIRTTVVVKVEAE